jgi:HD-like signal output (HDOD) protein
VIRVGFKNGGVNSCETAYFLGEQVDQMSVSLARHAMSTILLKTSSLSRKSRSEKSIFDYLEDPKATSTLPSLKSVLGELEKLTQQSNIRIDEVTRLVQVDQGMSLRVLRMANSVYYAPAQPILDVQDAILYIGLNTFRGAVVSTRCIEKTCHIKQETLDWKEFWTHGASVGQLTVELASHLKSSDLSLESFYLMGLLHDIGKVVLAHLMPEKFDELYAGAILARKAPATVEKESLGIEHGHLGAWYLEKQGIPLALCEAVRFHHAPLLDGKPQARHAMIVQLADLLARHHHLGHSGNESDTGDPFTSPEWQAYLGQCHAGVVDGDEFKGALVERIAKISDLVRSIIS